ncbi:sortase family enzyme [Frankia sp. EI5c]|uniref:class F sortase n=1 Tax=Frankia sp. EI5c TaxID=683316 RepID=UPI0007C40B3D|nr:class F sortase [Frankia sp. EI5c]OAA28611.1 sortase family enzyme [Frankia sp. EI5c]
MPARMTFSRLLLVAGAVLVVGSGFRLADGGSEPVSDTERVAVGDLGTEVGQVGAPAGAGGAAVPMLPPVVVTDPTRVRIPAIGVDAPIIRLGLNADRSLAVPKKWGEVGWYDKGPAPGAVGPSVLVGHYDSTSGPAVFYRLRALRAGDQIEILSPTGLRTTFTVDRTEDVTKKEFPTERAYGPVSRPELRLITCAGAFDEKTKHYLSNLIVYAHANSVPAAAAGAADGPAAGGAAPPGGTPSAGAPSAGAPSAGTPGAGTPGAGTPNVGAPAAAAPPAGAPGVGGPGAGAQKADAQKTDASNAGVPAAGAPAAGAPSAGVPPAGAAAAGAPPAGTGPAGGGPSDAGPANAGAPSAGVPNTGAPNTGAPAQGGLASTVLAVVGAAHRLR